MHTSGHPTRDRDTQVTYRVQFTDGAVTVRASGPVAAVADARKLKGYTGHLVSVRVVK